MWKILETGTAQWETADGLWNVDAKGGESGITLQARDRGVPLAGLHPVGRDALPEATESFVRGDTWHVHYSQAQGSYSLDLVFRPIESSAKRLVLELTLSIHTSLLDSHPTIDLVAEGDGFRVWTPRSEFEWYRATQPSDSGGASCLTAVIGETAAVSVLLGRRDYPFTLDLSDDRAIQLRLFGDFLEKGVIRKARPWICMQRDVKDVDESAMIDLWHRLQESPLPLTP